MADDRLQFAVIIVTPEYNHGYPGASTQRVDDLFDGTGSCVIPGRPRPRGRW